MNRKALRVSNAQIIAAVDRHVTDEITLEAAVYPPTKLKGVFRQHTEAMQVSDAAEAQWRQRVKEEKAAAAEAARVRRALRTYLMGHYGPEAVEILADFGFRPTQSPPTVEAKARAVEKRLATRQARHTMGKKQRARIKGDPHGQGVAAAPVADATSSNGVNGTTN